VHAATLKGRWHYLEHDWWIEEGGYSFELPGETHTLLEVLEGCDEMATLFQVTGIRVCGSLREGRKVEDVFSKIKMARKHYEKVGLGVDPANQFIR
jgi:2,4'-dihydroxyacetophenone dioxygenase